MTKEEYISEHPRSYLANALLLVDWPYNAKIIVGSGLIAPHTKQSNLYNALQNTTGEYVVGGHRMRGTEGFWFAVRV